MVQFPSEGKRHHFKPTEIISFLPFLAILETNCLASEFSSSFFHFAPSSSGYTTPEPQLCFNFQNPVWMTQASLQTENACRASGTTKDDLKKSQCIIKHKPPALIHMTQGTVEKYLKETHILHFCCILQTQSKQFN